MTPGYWAKKLKCQPKVGDILTYTLFNSGWTYYFKVETVVGWFIYGTSYRLHQEYGVVKEKGSLSKFHLDKVKISSLTESQFKAIYSLIQ